MASNSLNSNPILINTDLTSSWRNQQTLNTGNNPTTIQNPTQTYRMPGIRPVRLQLVSAGVTVGGLVSVTDPNDSTLLWQGYVTSAAGAAGTIIIDELWDSAMPTWRNFTVTGVTATVTQLQIWYRQ